jgi:hypothetical protein
MAKRARTRNGCDDRPRPCRRRCRYRCKLGLCVLELARAGEHELEDIALLLGTSEGSIREALCAAMNKVARAVERGEED